MPPPFFCQEIRDVGEPSITIAYPFLKIRNAFLLWALPFSYYFFTLKHKKVFAVDP